MMDEHADSSMDEMKAAKPVYQPSAKEWLSSDRGQRLLERVLATAQVPAAAQDARAGRPRGHGAAARPWRDHRLLLAAAAAALVVVVGVTLGLVLAGPGGGTPGPVAAGVTKLNAVEHVAQMVLSGADLSFENTGSEVTNEAALLSEAVSLGLVTSAELDAGSGAEPMLEGQYAVVLWKAFGHYFPVAAGSTGPASGDQGAELTVALTGLRLVGVIKDADGAFEPERPLTVEREQLLLARMRAALRGQTSQ